MRDRHKLYEGDPRLADPRFRRMVEYRLTDDDVVTLLAALDPGLLMDQKHVRVRDYNARRKANREPEDGA